MSPRTSRPSKARPAAPDADNAAWRLFLAIPVPEDVKGLVGRETERLKQEGWPVRWVQPENAHITLHFLGETSTERAELLRFALLGAVAAQAPFTLRTAAFGVFPSYRRPGVLWLGLHGPVHRLERMQKDIGQTLRKLSFAIAEEPYHPHITLGRVREGDGERVRRRDLPEAVKAAFVDRASGAAIAPPPLPVPVRDVVLVRSHLGKGPPKHEQIAAFPLAAGGDESA